MTLDLLNLPYDDFEYTISVRYIVNIMEVNMFNFEYNKSTITFYPELEEMFINHYMFREIGFETVEKFLHFLRYTWKQKTSVYNKKFLTLTQNIKILSNNSLQGGGSVNTSSSGGSKSIYNDTPNSKLTQSDFATSITDNTLNNMLDSFNSTFNSGYYGVTEIELMNKYLDNLRDLKQEFINEFDVLFMRCF